MCASPAGAHGAYAKVRRWSDLDCQKGARTGVSMNEEFIGAFLLHPWHGNLDASQQKPGSDPGLGPVRVAM